MDAIEALKTRRCVRSFKPDPLQKETLEDIIDCGRLAATARNEQPWEFVVVTDPAMRKQIADATDFGKFIANAPACIAVLCEDGKYYLEDGSAATQNILVAARAHGLGACWVAGDKKAYAPKICAMRASGSCKWSPHRIGTSAEFQTSENEHSTVLHWENSDRAGRHMGVCDPGSPRQFNGNRQMATAGRPPRPCVTVSAVTTSRATAARLHSAVPLLLRPTCPAIGTAPGSRHPGA